MLGSLFTGITGINSNSRAMSVIGNNIANTNTTGYKSSRASFEDILGQSIHGGQEQIGRGVILSSINRIFSQGALSTTDRVTDMAINGGGFFVLKDGFGLYYSRAGEFSMDENGKLVNPNGLVAQGWKADASGNISTTGAIADINLANVTFPPKGTTNFTIGANLDAKASNGDTYATSIAVYDSKGNKIILSLNFTYDDTNKEWDWTSSAGDGATVDTGSIKFDTNGNIISPNADPTISITGLSSGAADLNLTWDLVDASGSSNGDITGYASASATTSLKQDGYGAGSLKSISVNEKGIISGFFSNGLTWDLAQVALADFNNPDGLISAGGNLFMESRSSGSPIVAPAGTTGMGSIAPNSLELSNTDLVNEFVNMITAQRGFQANARVITTSDEILTELVNLKR
jgi:flagellar hook protein FlgE